MIVSPGNKWSKLRNVLVVFTVSGFWHGANWNFIVWGFLHGLFYAPYLIFNVHKKYASRSSKEKLLPTPQEFAQILLTFFLVTLSWIFFRAENMNHAVGYLGGILDLSFFSIPTLFRSGFIWIMILVIMEWVNRDQLHVLEKVEIPRYLRIGIYYLLIILILVYQGSTDTPFIYFQF